MEIRSNKKIFIQLWDGGTLSFLTVSERNTFNKNVILAFFTDKISFVMWGYLEAFRNSKVKKTLSKVEKEKSCKGCKWGHIWNRVQHTV